MYNPGMNHAQVAFTQIQSSDVANLVKLIEDAVNRKTPTHLLNGFIGVLNKQRLSVNVDVPLLLKRGALLYIYLDSLQPNVAEFCIVPDLPFNRTKSFSANRMRAQAILIGELSKNWRNTSPGVMRLLNWTPEMTGQVADRLAEQSVYFQHIAGAIDGGSPPSQDSFR